MAKPAAVKKEPVGEKKKKKKTVVVAKKQPRSLVGRVYDYTSPIFKYGAIATAGLAGSVLAPGLLLNPITGAAIGAGTLAYLTGEKTLGKALIAGGTPYLVKDLRDYNINRELLETGISEAGRGPPRSLHVDPDVEMLSASEEEQEQDVHMIDRGVERKRRRSSTTSLDNRSGDDQRQRPQSQGDGTQPINIPGSRAEFTRLALEFGLREATGPSSSAPDVVPESNHVQKKPKVQEYVAQPVEVPKFLLDFGSSQNKADFILREAVSRFNPGRFNRFNF